MKMVGRKRIGARIKEKCKKVVRNMVLAGALMAPIAMPLGKAAAAEPVEPPKTVAVETQDKEEEQAAGWAVARPGYAPRTNQLMLRIEGGASYPVGTSFYGFMDFVPSRPDSAGIDSFYGEARVLQKIYGGLAVLVEFDAGSGMEPIFRPGLAYSIAPDDWLLQARVMPWSLGGVGDVQLALYGCKTFGGRLFNEVLLKVNVISETIYGEIAADVLFLERLSAGLQLRVFSSLKDGKTELIPVLRIGVSL